MPKLKPDPVSVTQIRGDFGELGEVSLNRLDNIGGNASDRGKWLLVE
jgi:hypothetical protein